METESPAGVESRELAAELGANGVDLVMTERFKQRMCEMPAGEREPMLAGALSHYTAAIAKALIRRDDRGVRHYTVLALLYAAAYDEIAADDIVAATS